MSSTGGASAMTGTTGSAAGDAGATSGSTRKSRRDAGGDDEKSKEEKVFMDRCYEAKHKVEQSSEALLPRICENIAKPHSGLQGSMMVAEALLERLDKAEDPEVVDMAGKAVIALMVKGNLEQAEYFVKAAHLPGRAPTRLARAKSLGLVSGQPKVVDDGVEALKSKFQTLLDSLEDNKEELAEKQLQLREMLDMKAQKDSRLDKLRSQTKDKALSEDKKLEEEIKGLKQSIKDVESGKLQAELEAKTEAFKVQLAEHRKLNAGIIGALFFMVKSDLDLHVKEAALVSLLSVVEPESEQHMQLVLNFLDGIAVRR